LSSTITGYADGAGGGSADSPGPGPGARAAAAIAGPGDDDIDDIIGVRWLSSAMTLVIGNTGDWKYRN